MADPPARAAWVGPVLALRPRAARDSERTADGRVAILVPKFGGAILGRWLQPRLKNPYQRLVLDEVGSAVWERCDGTASGHEIARFLAERFPDMQSPTERLALFVRALLRDGHLRA